jgi:CHAT domain-containing protein
VIQRIQQRAETNPTAESLANFGALLLFDNRPEQALAHLEEAARLSPHDAEIRNDLAVAQLTIALRGDPPSFIHAIASAHRALQLSPTLSAAKFNYALAWSALYPSRLALAAWNDFLSSDSTSGWVAEARARQAHLRQPTAAETWARTRELLLGAALQGDAATVEPLVRSFPQQARQELEETLLSKWGELTLADRQREAAEILGSITQIAAALRNRGDPLPMETVAAIRRASSPAALHTAALGHQAFGQGLALYREGEPSKAAPFFRLSEQRLRSIGSPFADWATYYRAVCQYNDSHYADTLETLAPLLESTADRTPNLIGKAEWLAGLTHVVQGDLRDSLLYYRKALSRFRRTGEEESVAALRGLLAENLRWLGTTQEPWSYLVPALAAAAQVIDPRRAQILAEEAVDSCLRLGEPTVALLFENETVEHLIAPGDSVARALALQRRAQLHIRMGNRTAASADLAEALKTVSRINDVGYRESMSGDLLAALGQLEAGKDWSRAAQAFGAAVADYRATGYFQALPELYLKRAGAFMAQGKEDLADLDIKAAAQELERQRDGLSDSELRATFFDASRPIFDYGIALAADRGNWEDAFDRNDASKARTVLDLLTRPDGAGSEALALHQIQKQLPAGVALVTFRVLPDRWIAWVVRRDGFSHVERPTSETVIEDQVRRLRDSAASPARSRSFEAASDALYRELIVPLEPEIAGSSLLVFVPDRSLHRLPFGALRNPSSRRFLLESFAVAKSPSASVYIEALRKGWPSHPDRESALILGDPDFNAERYSLLSSLPAARREALHIATSYTHPIVRVGSAALKQVFLDEAGRQETVFFAGHTAVNEKTPWKAGLLFASRAPDSSDELLTAEEIERIRFEKTQLVVLSACGTADGQIGASEGPMSLARPFLAGGVPLVIGTLWDVEDEAAASLLSTFSEHLRAGEPPLKALRQAQLEALKQPGRSPSGWAAFELIGGASPLG